MCFPPSGETDEFQVVLGGVSILKQEEMDQVIPVIRTIVHENYRKTPVALYNDVGLSYLLHIMSFLAQRAHRPNTSNIQIWQQPRISSNYRTKYVVIYVCSELNCIYVGILPLCFLLMHQESIINLCVR